MEKNILAKLSSFKRDAISQSGWDITLYSLGNIGILYAESTTINSKTGNFILPSWFTPTNTFRSVVGGDNSNATGEIQIDTENTFTWWCNSIGTTGMYTGEIVVILK